MLEFFVEDTIPYSTSLLESELELVLEAFTYFRVSDL